MKFTDLTTTKTEFKSAKQAEVNEAVKIQHIEPDSHFIGMEPGTTRHSKMKDVMAWTKDADPELYNKIMNLD